MKINIDIDGVIGDNTDLFCRYINKNYNRDYSREDISEYNPEFSFGKDLSQVISEMYTKCPEFIAEMDIIEGAKSSIEYFKQKDYYIQIVTHRPDTIGDITKEWLDSNNIIYDNLVIDAPSDKSQIDGDVMIDDNPNVVRNFKEQPHHTILFPRHYNKNINENYLIKPEDYVEYTVERILNKRNSWDIIRDIIDEELS